MQKKAVLVAFVVILLTGCNSNTVSVSDSTPKNIKATVVINPDTAYDFWSYGGSGYTNPHSSVYIYRDGDIVAIRAPRIFRSLGKDTVVCFYGKNSEFRFVVADTSGDSCIYDTTFKVPDSGSACIKRQLIVTWNSTYHDTTSYNYATIWFHKYNL